MAHLFNRFSGHKILLFSLLLPLLISIVFSSSSFPFFIVSILLLLISTVFILRPLVSDSIRDCQLPSLVHFVAMSRVVNNNRGFLQFLADCSYLSAPVSFKDSYSTATTCTSPSLIQRTHGTYSHPRRK